MFSAASVCLFVCLFVCVCLFVNTITAERVNIGWWNLEGRCVLQKSRPGSNLGVIAAWLRIPPKCGVRLRRLENQRRLSSLSLHCQQILPCYCDKCTQSHNCCTDSTGKTPHIHWNVAKSPYRRTENIHRQWVRTLFIAKCTRTE